MPWTIRFHPLAAQEAEDAVGWYADQRESLAGAFSADLEATVARVAHTPEAYVERAVGVRQALLRRFPYKVIYRLQEGAVIEVVAVAHTHRAPDYWVGR